MILTDTELTNTSQTDSTVNKLPNVGQYYKLTINIRKSAKINFKRINNKRLKIIIKNVLFISLHNIFFTLKLHFLLCSDNKQ